MRDTFTHRCLRTGSPPSPYRLAFISDFLLGCRDCVSTLTVRSRTFNESPTRAPTQAKKKKVADSPTRQVSERDPSWRIEIFNLEIDCSTGIVIGRDHVRARVILIVR